MSALWRRSADHRSETLIASGRAALALSSLLALIVDPPEQVEHADVLFHVLLGYSLYAVVVAVVLWRSPVIVLRDRLTMHGFDLVVFSTLIAFTKAPTSPFFSLIVFLVISASLRWRRRGVAWTAGAGMAVFVGSGLSHLGDTWTDLDRFIIRGAALVVVAGMIGYMAADEHRLRGDAEKLAAWPSTAGRPLPDVIRDSLRDAADVVGAPRVVVMWNEPDEPVRLAWWARGEFGTDRQDPERWPSIVSEPLAGHDFLCPDVTSDGAEVLYSDGTTLQRWRGRPLDAAFAERFAIRSVLSVRMRESGRLFFLDTDRLTTDDFQPARIVARYVMASFEHAVLLENSQAMAAGNERMRLARDLHDGLLQSLTTLSFQLEAAARGLDDDARARIEWIQGRLGDERRRLRLFTAELRSPASLGEEASGLDSELHRLVGQLARDWGVAVNLSLDGAPGFDALSGPIVQDLYFIVHEAVSNAARHGGASVVQVDVAIEDGSLKLKVTDDGRGFPFRGRYDEADLSASEMGPVSLAQRVRGSGGHLTIDSQPFGARLEITLPIERVGR